MLETETAQGASQIYKLAPRFVGDHQSRDIFSDDVEIIKWGKSQVQIRMNLADYSELLDDARYYADQIGEGTFDAEMSGVCKSAAAVVKQLIKQGAPAKAAS